MRTYVGAMPPPPASSELSPLRGPADPRATWDADRVCQIKDQTPSHILIEGKRYSFTGISMPQTLVGHTYNKNELFVSHGNAMYGTGNKLHDTVTPSHGDRWLLHGKERPRSGRPDTEPTETLTLPRSQRANASLSHILILLSELVSSEKSQPV